MSTSSDPVATLFAGVVIGAAAGGTITAGALAWFYGLRAAADPGFGQVAVISGLSGLGVAALAAVLIARAGGMMRAMLAAVAAVLGAFLFIVLTTYADRLAGRNGLVVLAALCLAIGAGAWLLFLRHPAPASSP